MAQNSDDAQIQAEMKEAEEIVDVFVSPIPSFRPGGQEYEKSVATSNLLYRFSRPYFVVQPESAAHIQTVVNTAVSRGLKITVKNGGHSFAGFSSTDRGILIDLARMQQVRLNNNLITGKPETVTLAGGAQWGHAYKVLISGRHDGYIINGGRCPTVGVSGFVLGGGLGPFTRVLGMGCDSLTEATIITADGNLVTVGEKDDKDSDKGKLFWALRGAGCGSFGVVVELKMKVQRVQENIVTGRFTYHSKLDKAFVNTMKRIYRFDWPDAATIDTHWLCDVKPNNSSSSVRFVIYFDGNKIEFDRLVDRAIGKSHLTTPLPHHGAGHQHEHDPHQVQPPRMPTTDPHVDDLAYLMKERALPEPSTLLLHESLVLQWWEETIRALPTNKSYSVYTSFVFERRAEITDIATDIVRAHMDDFQREFVQDTASLEVTFVHAGGVASRIKDSDTAFPWRAGTYFVYIMIRWDDKWLSDRVRRFLHAFKTKLRPFSMNRKAAYVNFTDVAMRDYAAAYYGTNYPSLQQVKMVWDKFDYFHAPQGIRLPGSKRDTDDNTAADGVNWTDMAYHQWENRSGLPPPRDEYPGVVRNLADLKF